MSDTPIHQAAVQGTNRHLLRFVPPFAFLTVLLVSCGVQGPNAASERQAPSKQEDVFVFPAVAAGTLVEHTFSFTNLTDRTLRISSVDNACSCTVTTPTRYVVAPLESTEIQAALQTTGKSGWVEVPFTCVFDSGMRHDFTFKGFVSASELAPLSIGTVDRGAARAFVFEIPADPEHPWEVREIEFPEAVLNVHEKERAPAKRVYEVKLRPDVPYGAIDADVRVETTDPLNPRKTAHVTGYVRFPVELEPKELALGLAAAEGGCKGTARVFAPYGDPIEIEAIEQVRGNPTTWSVTRTSPSELRIDVEAQQGDADPVISTELSIKAKAGGGSYPVTLMAYGLGDIVARKQ